MNYDKTTQIFIVFIIIHKNTINTIYFRLCGGEQTFRENIHPPCHVSTRSFREDCA